MMLKLRLVAANLAIGALVSSPMRLGFDSSLPAIYYSQDQLLLRAHNS